MFPLTEPLAIVEHYSGAFSEVLRPQELDKMKRYVSGLLLSQNKTIEGINQLFILDVQHPSTLNRLLTDSHFDVEQLNERRVAWLQSCEQMAFKHREGEKGCLIIDDTLLLHYGEHFEKAAWLYDHVSEAYHWSHCLVNLHYSDDVTDYPVDWRLWEPADVEQVETALREMGCQFAAHCLRRKEEDPAAWRSYLLKKYARKRVQPLKGKELRLVYDTKIDLAIERLDTFYKNYPQADLPVAFDTWYTCKELCTHIDKVLQRSYVGTLDGEHVVLLGAKKEEKTMRQFTQQLLDQHREALRQGRKPLFEKVSIHYKGQKETYYAYCRTHHVQSLGRQRLVISFSKEDLSDPKPKYYISNRLHWRSGGILRIRRHRWPIETYHEEGKAEGLDKYQLRQFEGVKKHIAFVCLAYSMLKRVQFDEPFLNKLQWRPNLENRSLAFWRRVMTANAIISLIHYVLAQLHLQEDWSHLLPRIAKAYL